MKQLKVILVSLERQGCTIKPTSKGYLILFPDGETSTTFHKTPSDVRVLKNMRSRILRAGLLWPLDGDTHQKNKG
jgi:hypothetical protein